MSSHVQPAATDPYSVTDANHTHAGDALTPLRVHPAFPVADFLARYVGLKRNLSQFTLFLSLAGGRMATPINLEIFSDSWSTDLHVTHAVLDLLHRNVEKVDTLLQFRDLEGKGFRDLAAILIRGDYPDLFRRATEATSHCTLSDFYLPSLWRVTDQPLQRPPLPSTLRLLVTAEDRSTESFPEVFATPVESDAETFLVSLLERLKPQPLYDCTFRARFRGKIDANSMFIFERLLLILAELRIRFPNSPDVRKAITTEDYHAARALLCGLPVTPIDRKISPAAMRFGETIFKEIEETNHQLELPDRSAEGSRWFTRHDARRWTDLSYTGVKNHLEELEGEGLIIATLAQNNRERGKQIHFRFRAGVQPPFGWNNPFDGLPQFV